MTIFERIKALAKPETRKTHNYTSDNRYWGHDYTIISINGDEIVCCGWGCGLSKGDYFVFTNHETHHSTRYQIKEVSYFSDPRDMWKAKMVFSPRATYSSLAPV